MVLVFTSSGRFTFLVALMSFELVLARLAREMKWFDRCLECPLESVSIESPLYFDTRTIRTTRTHTHTDIQNQIYVQHRYATESERENERRDGMMSHYLASAFFHGYFLKITSHRCALSTRRDWFVYWTMNCRVRASANSTSYPWTCAKVTRKCSAAGEATCHWLRDRADDRFRFDSIPIARQLAAIRYVP